MNQAVFVFYCGYYYNYYPTGFKFLRCYPSLLWGRVNGNVFLSISILLSDLWGHDQGFLFCAPFDHRPALRSRSRRDCSSALSALVPAMSSVKSLYIAVKSRSLKIAVDFPTCVLTSVASIGNFCSALCLLLPL